MSLGWLEGTAALSVMLNDDESATLGAKVVLNDTWQRLETGQPLAPGHLLDRRAQSGWRLHRREGHRRGTGPGQ
jgi:hypothetical protein